MPQSKIVPDLIRKIYPISYSFIPSAFWMNIAIATRVSREPDLLPSLLMDTAGEIDLPDFVAELARLEWTIHEMNCRQQADDRIEDICLNPAMRILAFSWTNLLDLLHDQSIAKIEAVHAGKELVLVWNSPSTRTVQMKIADDEDLLVLKIIAEDLDAKEVSRQGGLPPKAIFDAIDRAISRGVLCAPPTRLRREGVSHTANDMDPSFIESPTFTLQWHITNTCELHCKHCYDRSDRLPLEFDKALEVLDDLVHFCENRHVRGYVTFTGGNPLLYPKFYELYRAAAERGFGLSILGNPTPRQRMEELIAIQKPECFQVSLEGLEVHNDYIREKGHFQRVLQFLALLRELGVYSMVMLTLTSKNIDQVIPLAGLLRDKADVFHFNRVSLVGEGINMRLPDKEVYRTFLSEFLDASRKNPVIGLKDNLLNVTLHGEGLRPFGGCTGFGCGAAFNFIALLPDGEVHACRKFPSPIGNVFTQSIAEIYDSEKAGKYRTRPGSCRECELSLTCGGCLAVISSAGLDISEDRDPLCFKDSN